MKGDRKIRSLCYQQNELFALWRYGKNDCEIADAMGVTSSAIWQWRKRNDLPKNAERGRQW